MCVAVVVERSKEELQPRCSGQSLTFYVPLVPSCAGVLGPREAGVCVRVCVSVSVTRKAIPTSATWSQPRCRLASAKRKLRPVEQLPSDLCALEL